MYYISLLYLCCCSCFLMLEDEFCNTSPLVAWLYWDLAALDLISMLILAFLEGAGRCYVLKCTSLLVLFPVHVGSYLLGSANLMHVLSSTSFNLSSWACSSCTLVVPLNSPVEPWLRACRLPEVFSALGVLAIHFLSYASLLIQKLWLSTWEGGLHLVITTGKWDLW
jgi:hypothetical protein